LVNVGSGVEFSNGLFAFGCVPNLDDLVFSTSAKEFSVWTDCNGVDVAILWLEAESDLEVVVPYFDSSIPTDGCEVWL